MVVFPNCKINLGLYVIDESPDGYHNIETVFYPLNLCDILEINKSDKLSIQYSGISIDSSDKNNLCIKAYKLIEKEYELPPVKIHLHKAIPIGAGLGGGSSDAAYTIKLLNTLFALNLSENKMEHYARQTGSDSAFFIRNKPVLATGYGDKFSDMNLSLKDKHVLIIKPDVHINTQIAYRLIEPDNKRNSLRAIVEKPVTEWKDKLVNDFEKPMFCRYPQMRVLKERLYKEGAVYASLTGSGSAFYGIFADEPNAEKFIDMGFIWKGLL